jgi:thioredoxin reductase (NADPH)
VVRIERNSLQVATPEGEITIANDFVFALVGYRPDMKFLNAAGITLDPDTLRPRTNPETLESTRPGVYLAGVIVAGLHTNEIFIENGRLHGQLIANSIASRIAF